MPTPLETLNQFILALEHWSKYENYNKIYDSFHGSGAFRSIPFPVNKDVNLFRCRIHDGIWEGKTFNKWDDIGYNRCSKSIRKYGRCNKPFQSVGYYSDQLIGSCLETISRSQKGEQFEITIGKWKLIKPINLFSVVEPDERKRIHPYEKLLGRFYDGEIAIKTDADIIKLYHRYFSYLNKKFTSKADGLEYQVTAAYSNKCYEIRDGIAYASIASKISYNLALKAELEDAGALQLKKAYKIIFVVKNDLPASSADIKIESYLESESVNQADKSIVWQSDIGCKCWKRLKMAVMLKFGLF